MKMLRNLSKMAVIVAGCAIFTVPTPVQGMAMSTMGSLGGLAQPCALCCVACGVSCCLCYCCKPCCKNEDPAHRAALAKYQRAHRAQFAQAQAQAFAAAARKPVAPAMPVQRMPAHYAEPKSPYSGVMTSKRAAAAFAAGQPAQLSKRPAKSALKQPAASVTGSAAASSAAAKNNKAKQN